MQKDEILSMKQIILSIKENVFELISNYKIIILVIIPFSIYYTYKFYNTRPIYFAEVKFLVEGNASSGGSLGGLLGQFGLRNTGKSNPYKIVEVAKSKYIFQKVMFSKYNNDFIANHIVKIYRLNEKWGKNEPLFRTFGFRNSEIEKFDSLERIAFVQLFSKVMGGKNSKEALVTFNYEEDKGIYSYKINCEDENLAINLQNKSYEYLRHFFEEDMLENSLKTSMVLRDKADSIQGLLQLKIAQMANLQDRSLGLILSTPGVKKMTLEKEIQALTLAYTEVLKSYELADINLRDAKPLFLKMDESISPLDIVIPSLFINLLKAALLGVFFSCGYILARKSYRKIMLN
jgi:hypothetical protein